jgi:hypothetical protein
MQTSRCRRLLKGDSGHIPVWGGGERERERESWGGGSERRYRLEGGVTET